MTLLYHTRSRMGIFATSGEETVTPYENMLTPDWQPFYYNGTIEIVTHPAYLLQ